MPTPPKRLENQTKHLTNREKAARERAERGLARVTRVQLRAPHWMGPEARQVWDGIKRKLRKLELLDNLDADLLAVYCDAQAHYQALSASIHRGDNPVDDELVKQAQSWARLISGYAEKLGLSPNARTRLAKKRAEKEPLDAMEQLLGEVSDFVNEER
jgi:P27 family predicted phage terminase small subunit